MEKKLFLTAKPNKLIEAQYSFSSIHEHRLFFAMLAKIYKGYDPFVEMKIPISYILGDVLKKSRLSDSGTYYKYIKTASQRIMNRSVNLSQSETEFEMIPLVVKAKFTKAEQKENHIKVRFHKDIIPVFDDMFSHGYTKMMLQYLYNLKSFYSIRIYELLKQYLRFKKRVITLDDLRWYLGIETDKLKMYANFKKTVLKRAQNELIKHTDIAFEFYEIKKGNKIVSIEFYIFENVVPVESQQIELKFEEELSDEHKRKYFRLQQYLSHLYPDSQYEIKKKYTYEYIEYYYKKSRDAERSRKIKTDFSSFFYMLLIKDRDDFYSKAKEKQKIENEKRIIRDQEEEEMKFQERMEEQIFNQQKKLFLQLSIEDQKRRISKTSNFLQEEQRENMAIMDMEL